MAASADPLNHDGRGDRQTIQPLGISAALGPMDRTPARAVENLQTTIDFQFVRPVFRGAINKSTPMKSPHKTVQKPRQNPSGKVRGGRPSREEAERRRILALGVDPALVEPRRILAALAIDESAPATARVQACKLLIATGAGAPALPPPAVVDDEILEGPGDEISRRALALMAHGRPN